MVTSGSAPISAAVEGVVDEAVLRRIVAHTGGTLGYVYGMQGKQWLRNKVRAYSQASRLAPWMILVDLDHDEDCAPALRRLWIPQPTPHLCFRIAVREVEAWLLADAEAVAGFLRVSPDRVPTDPDGLPDPKCTMVALAARSRSNTIRQDITPRPGSGRSVGPAYASRMMEFASRTWRPDAAADRSDSLKRALAAVARLSGGPV